MDLDLLDALHRPAKLAIVHCPGHQKGDSFVARGNRMADEEAKKAAQGASLFPLIEKKTVLAEPLPSENNRDS